MAWLAVVTAVLTLVAAALGVLAASKSSQASASDDAAQSASGSVLTLSADASLYSGELSSAGSVIASLSQAVEAQQSLNVSLSSRLAEASTVADSPAQASTTSPDPSPSSTGAPTVRHGPESIRLAANGDGIDLDAPATDARWVGKQSELSLFSGGLTLRDGARARDVGGTEPTYESCNKPLGYAGYRVFVKDLVAPSYLCVITDEKRFAVVQIAGVTENYVDVVVTTFT